MGELVIYIDLQKAQDLDQNLALQKLYYRPEGYYRTAEKMQMACKKAGYGFTLAVIKNWLNKQALHQIHRPPASPNLIVNTPIKNNPEW